MVYLYCFLNLTQGQNMKKIMFLFLMVMGLMSSLYALDTGQAVGCDIEKSQWGEGADSVTATPSDVTYVKVNILHRDTLICGLTVTAVPINWKQFEKDLDIIISQAALTTDKQLGLPGISGGYSNLMGEGGV